MSSANLTVPTSVTEITSVTRQPLPRTHVPPLDHALKAHALQSNSAARTIGNVTATAQLFAQGIDAETWAELMQLQGAAWRRLHNLQKNWFENWTAWAKYADQIHGANTTAKFVERECNIVAQLSQLLGQQVTDLVSLQENVEVDYFYWVHEKLNEKRLSVSAAL